MQRNAKPLHSAGLAVVALFLLTLRAQAGMIRADALPIPNRVAAADLVVAGKVAMIEDKTVMIPPFRGAKNEREFKVAHLDVTDPLLAPKGTKTINLAFVLIPPMVAISPRPFQATVGQEGCYFLTRLTGDVQDAYYFAEGGLSFLAKDSPSYAKDLALVKRCVKILEDPNAALKGKNAEERFLAAAMLVARYSTPKAVGAKREPIDAEQSKEILQALAAADWTPPADSTQLSPLMVLGRLPLTAQDGWAPPKDVKALPAYAQQWVRDHVDTYRIQKFVAEKSK